MCVGTQPVRIFKSVGRVPLPDVAPAHRYYARRASPPVISSRQPCGVPPTGDAITKCWRSDRSSVSCCSTIELQFTQVRPVMNRRCGSVPDVRHMNTERERDKSHDAHGWSKFSFGCQFMHNFVTDLFVSPVAMVDRRLSLRYADHGGALVRTRRALSVCALYFRGLGNADLAGHDPAQLTLPTRMKWRIETALDRACRLKVPPDWETVLVDRVRQSAS